MMSSSPVSSLAECYGWLVRRCTPRCLLVLAFWICCMFMSPLDVVAFFYRMCLTETASRFWLRSMMLETPEITFERPCLLRSLPAIL